MPLIDADHCLVCDDYVAGLISRASWEYYCGGGDEESCCSTGACDR